MTCKVESTEEIHRHANKDHRPQPQKRMEMALAMATNAFKNTVKNLNHPRGSRDSDWNVIAILAIKIYNDIPEFN